MTKHADDTSKEYQPMEVSFGDFSLFTKLTMLPGSFISTQAYLLVPVEALPDVQQWMNKHLKPDQSGNQKLIDFLMEKGSLLHNEKGPAYSVVKHHEGPGFDYYETVREEYWEKGQRQPRPLKANTQALKPTGEKMRL